MNIRADQVAGGAFIILGILVFIIGWICPSVASPPPGAGMPPKLMAGLMIAFAAGIIINGQRSEKLSEIPLGATGRMPF